MQDGVLNLARVNLARPASPRPMAQRKEYRPFGRRHVRSGDGVAARPATISGG